mgnify:CR=1 FL=1
MNIKLTWLIAVILLLVGLIAGYFYGQSQGTKSGHKQGYTEGYLQAQLDLRKLGAPQAGTEETAAGAAPTPAVPSLFGATVTAEEINPLEKAKEALNPFQ